MWSRPRLRPAIVVAVAACLFRSAGVGAQVVQEDFYVTNGGVGTTVLSGSTLYIGGGFTQVGPATGSGVPIDGSGVPLSGFPKVNGFVYAVASLGTSGWLIGGSFTSVGGVPRSNLAHILADNTVTAWNPSPNNAVHVLARRGSTVYAGGYFSNIGGQPRGRIAAIDLTSGQATSWNPGADGLVRALRVSLDGSTVYAAGDFTNIGGQARNNIAALSVMTGLATSWNPNASYSGKEIPVVYSLTLSTTGVDIVYVGGLFTNIGGQPRNNIAAIDAATGLATPWNPNASSVVEALAVSGGAVYAGGSFTTIGGQPRNRIAVLDTSPKTSAVSHSRLAS